ncbi:hypothetical protein VNO77_31555 [Canavalia gladiata]|uniref:Secreted protein n=1 Tax=Canavalia gladiata TaxID=3824 RepID=A0AAN9Q1T4_CANGL
MMMMMPFGSGLSGSELLLWLLCYYRRGIGEMMCGANEDEEGKSQKRQKRNMKRGDTTENCFQQSSHCCAGIAFHASRVL